MADYYSLLQRSLKNVADPRPETRRKVYERARSALITQLRSLNPPLPESDILRECLSLDEAVQAIEQHYLPPPDPEPTVYTPQRNPQDHQQDHFGAPSGYYSGYHPDPRTGQEYYSEPETYQEEGYQPQNYQNPAHSQQQGHYYAPVPEQLKHDPQKQTYLGTEGYHSQGQSQQGYSQEYYSAPTETQDPHYHGQDYDDYQSGLSDPNAPYPDSTSPTPNEPGRDYRPRVVIQPPEEKTISKKRRMILLGAIFSLIFVVASLALILKFRDSQFPQNSVPNTIVDSNGVITVSTTGKNPTTGSENSAHKIIDRVNETAATEGSDPGQEDEVVEHRAFLIEEVLLEAPNDRKRTAGCITWKLEKSNPSDQESNLSEKQDYTIHGHATFPDAKFAMDIKISKNKDETISAANTVLFQFSSSMPQDVKTVNKLLDFSVMFSQAQPDKSMPGAVVQLDKNTFVYAVQKSDLATLELLKQFPWFRVVVHYETSQGAAIIFEKGPEGKRIFEEAFRFWGQ